MDKGNTALILGPFVEGIGGAGGQVEMLYTQRLRIKPCLADYTCWWKTPGACVQKDDMRLVLPKIRNANVLVLATPVYLDGMPGPLKHLVDRMLPLLQPFFELRNGHCCHPAQGERALEKVVLVASCGFHELDNFDPLLLHVKALCRNLGAAFSGALLRPHGPMLGSMLRKSMPVEDVLSAAREAGRQLVDGGEIHSETMAVVSRELVPVESYLARANAHARRVLDPNRAKDE